MAALTAPYARHPSWTAACGGDGGPLWDEGRWSDVPFVHLLHNLEEGYDGLIELSAATPLAALHLLPAHLLHEEGRPAAINLSRAALLCASQARITLAPPPHRGPRPHTHTRTHMPCMCM